MTEYDIATQREVFDWLRSHQYLTELPDAVLAEVAEDLTTAFDVYRVQS